MDRAGFDSMEFFVSGRFKKVVREQRDNPWDWVRYGQKEIKNTRLRYHGGLSSGFSLIPACISRLVIERLVHYGITLTRLSDPWNNYDALQKEVTELRNLGMESVVNLIYSISPRHTNEYYARKAREAAAMKPYRLCFKDVGGMLTPDRTRSLVKIIRENIGDTTLEFHAHCNNGLAPFNVLEAVKEGIRIVHTSVPPLANGSAQPSVFNVVRNLRALGYKPMVNEQVLEPVEQHFRWIAKQEGLPIGAPREYDETWYRHQVPGGMRKAGADKQKAEVAVLERAERACQIDRPSFKEGHYLTVEFCWRLRGSKRASLLGFVSVPGCPVASTQGCKVGSK